MLAAPEADLEMDRLDRDREEARGIDRPRADPQGGQDLAEEPVVPGPERLPLAAPEEGTGVGRSGGPFVGVQAKADFSSSARSVRSQEKPPSASGSRPKCP